MALLVELQEALRRVRDVTDHRPSPKGRVSSIFGTPTKSVRRPGITPGPGPGRLLVLDPYIRPVTLRTARP